MRLTDNTLDLLNTMPKTLKKDITSTRSDFDSIERQVSKILDIPQTHRKEITNDIDAIS
jgi:hypothetical protein